MDLNDVKKSKMPTEKEIKVLHVDGYDPMPREALKEENCLHS